MCTFVTHSSQQSMQPGLIDHRAGEKRDAVLFQRDGQALKMAGPPDINVSLDANLVESRLEVILS